MHSSVYYVGFYLSENTKPVSKELTYILCVIIYKVYKDMIFSVETYYVKLLYRLTRIGLDITWFLYVSDLQPI